MMNIHTCHLGGFKTRAVNAYWVKEKSCNLFLFFSIPAFPEKMTFNPYDSLQFSDQPEDNCPLSPYDRDET
jgi:hypothetical protein